MRNCGGGDVEGGSSFCVFSGTILKDALKDVVAFSPCEGHRL
ncbi:MULTISPECIES: hypothetical protein [unclassified Bartonella]